MTPDIQNFAVTALSGLLASTLFLLVLFIGFCIVFGFPKTRITGKGTTTHRSLDEMVGEERYATYLLPSAPRGPADQLRTPELLEGLAARKP